MIACSAKIYARWRNIPPLYSRINPEWSRSSSGLENTEQEFLRQETLTLLLGFIAREIVIGALAVIYGGGYLSARPRPKPGPPPGVPPRSTQR